MSLELGVEDGFNLEHGFPRCKNAVTRTLRWSDVRSCFAKRTGASAQRVDTIKMSRRPSNTFSLSPSSCRHTKTRRSLTA
jgi:hypothetical protein